MADKKLIAITVIHRTLEPGVPADKSKGIRAKAPKVQVIQPGTGFLASTEKVEGEEKSEFDFLLDTKAAREPIKDEKVEIADDGEGGQTGTVKTGGAPIKDDLDKKSVTDLKKIADEKGLTYAGNASKGDLVALIRGSGDDLV